MYTFYVIFEIYSEKPLLFMKKITYHFLVKLKFLEWVRTAKFWKNAVLNNLDYISTISRYFLESFSRNSEKYFVTTIFELEISHIILNKSYLNAVIFN